MQRIHAHDRPSQTARSRFGTQEFDEWPLARPPLPKGNCAVKQGSQSSIVCSQLLGIESVTRRGLWRNWQTR